MRKEYYQVIVIDAIDSEQLNTICNVLVSYSIDYEIKFYPETLGVYMWIYEADYTKIWAVVNSVLGT